MFVFLTQFSCSEWVWVQFSVQVLKQVWCISWGIKNGGEITWIMDFVRYIFLLHVRHVNAKHSANGTVTFNKKNYLFFLNKGIISYVEQRQHLWCGHLYFHLFMFLGVIDETIYNSSVLVAGPHHWLLAHDRNLI